MKLEEEVRMMRKTIRRALLAGGLSLAVLVPTGAALADGSGPGPANPDRVCTGDQEMDRIRARDGTGWRHAAGDETAVEAQPGLGYQHRSGPLDGTGNQWRGGLTS